MVHRLAALLLLAAASSARAAALPSFEQTLNSFQAELRQGAPKRAAVRAASDLEWLGWDADRLRDSAEQMRRLIDNIRRRAQRSPNDPALRNEASQVSWRLRDFRWAVEEMERREARVRDTVKKDPALVAAAERLKSNLIWLNSETRWLESDGRWAAWDLRRAGLAFEAWEFEDQTRNANEAAARCERIAAEIADRVR